MKILIFDKNTCKSEFTNHGYGRLRFVEKCEITHALNGRYDIDLTVSIHDKHAKYIKKWSIIYVNGQLFRVVNKVDNDREQTINVFAKHIFYDIAYGFIENESHKSKKIDELVKLAIPTDFNYFEASSDMNDDISIDFIKTNGVKNILSIIDTLEKGELSRDNFKIAINESMGRDNGVTFTYKKIDAIEVIEDTESVVTRLYPTGKDGLSLAEKYVYVPNWSNEDYLPFHITKEVKFEEAESEGQLRILAEKEAEKIGLSRVSFKIKVHDLANTSLYKNMPELVKVEVGDLVTIKHEKLNIRTKVKCIQKTHELKTDSIILEFGQPSASFFDSIDNSNVSINIPNMSNLRNELFYYFNGNDIDFKTGKNVQLASMRIATSTTANLMCSVTLNPEIKASGVLKLRITINNEDIQFSPIINVHEGYSLLSYTIPLIAIDGGQTQVVKLWGEFDGVGSIPMNGLHFVITGQNVAMGAIKIEPFTGANISHKFEYDNYEIIDQIVKSNVELVGYDKCINSKSYAVKNLFDFNNVIGEVPNIFTENVNIIMRTEEEIQDKYVLKTGLYQEDNENIFYFGSWTTETHEKYNNGNGKYSTTTGSSIYFVTNGTEFKLYIPTDVNLGSFDVIVDNKYIETISQNSDELIINNNYYSYKFNSTGNHEVKLKVNDNNKTIFDTIEIIE